MGSFGQTLRALNEMKSEGVIVEYAVAGVLPAHNELADEAIETAAAMTYEGVPTRVVRPEYLTALYLEPGARTSKRLLRAATLRDSGKVDGERLQDLMRRFNLSF